MISNYWITLFWAAITTLFQTITSSKRTDNAHRMLGLVYGRGIMTPRQIPVALREWKTPQYEAFQPRTVWSLYNAITEALKSAPPQSIMEKHLGLHKLFSEQYKFMGVA